MTEYEMNYLLTGCAYLWKLHPEKLQSMLQEETGFTDLSKIIDVVNIELPGGRKKSLRYALIEFSDQNAFFKKEMKQNLGDLLPKKRNALKKEVADMRENSSVINKPSHITVSEIEKVQGKDFFSSLKEIFNKMTPEQKKDFVLSMLVPHANIVIHAKEQYAKLSTEEKKIVSNEIINLFTSAVPGL